MNKIDENTTYKIMFNDTSCNNIASLSHLYMPILGKDALLFYQWLHTEYMMGMTSNETFSQTHQRILHYLQVNLDQFDEIKSKLEQYQLISSYFDEVNHEVIYCINQPLSVKDFLANEVYVQTLRNVIGQEELEKTLLFLSPIDLNGVYTNISNTAQAIDNNNFEFNAPQYQFDFNQLFCDLLGNNVILDLSQDEHVCIEAYFQTHQYSYLDILNAIKTSLQRKKNKKSEYCLNLINLQNKMKDLSLSHNMQNINAVMEAKDDAINPNLRNELVLRDNKLFTDSEFAETKQTEILAWYGKYTFSQFYQIVTKDLPSSILEKNVNSIATKYELSNGIINMVADFTMFEIGKLNLNYFKKVCATINNLNLNSELKVLDHLRKFKKHSMSVKHKNIFKLNEQLQFNLDDDKSDNAVDDPFAALNE